MGVYKNAVLATSGVALFWDLDDTTSSATDNQGSNTGTCVGGYTQSVKGESGLGTTFDGSTGFVKTTTLPTTATTSVTLEAWFNTANASQTQQTICFLGSGSNGYGLVLNGNGATNGNLGGLYQVVAWIPGLGMVRSGEWHHAAMVIDSAGHATIYFDGYASATYSSNTPITPANGFMVGSSALTSTMPFNGTIDGVAVYTVALSAATIRAHYQAGELAYKGPKQFPSRPLGKPILDKSNTITSGLVVASPLGLDGGLRNLANYPDLVPTDDAGGTGQQNYSKGFFSNYEWTVVRNTHDKRPLATHKAISQRSFTAEVWATITQFTNISPYITTIWSSFPDGNSIIRFGDLTVSWSYLVAAGTFPNVRAQLDVPHQFVITGDGSAQKVYLDGQLVATGAVASNLTFSSSKCFGGDDTNSSGRFPDGQVHQYNLWNRPLSASEIFTRWNDPWGIYDPLFSSSLECYQMGTPTITRYYVDLIGTPASPSSIAGGATSTSTAFNHGSPAGSPGNTSDPSIGLTLIAGATAPTTAVTIRYKYSHNGTDYIQDGPDISLTMANSTTYTFRYDPPPSSAKSQIVVINGATNAITAWCEGSITVYT